MRENNPLKGIWNRIAGGETQETELSEELTNAYFGNKEAWQLENRQTESNQDGALANDELADHEIEPTDAD
ncbi:hypothetical protein [Effusibacillus dendaii]|uniref:Uncharacterized protein n=1 Tax=Effusibacillus dendaii TaxID=2743772 RepID=A0A7I8DCU5_9BACL|nr:hypothetical protein [Effusibacillus dendaii]BCJ85731.1 hypothetical protein skT53_07160 [Effusibacillus dendaii]